MKRMVLVAISAVLFVLGCPGASPPMGDEQMGRYSFRAERDPAEDPDASCRFVEIPTGGFDFEANFSRFRDAGLYYVTIGGVAHRATWDGQRISASYFAQRNFSECSCALDAGQRTTITMTETITAVIVSRSQSEAAGGCVDSPPFDPDAGITRPETTPGGGFDAVRACGTLTEHISVDPPITNPSANCLDKCNGCILNYVISGDRK